MGRPTPSAVASIPRKAALLAAAAFALGCVPQAHAFEDWNAAWTAEVSDRTGGVASIEVLDAADPGPDLTREAIRLWNVDASTIEVAWRGGACMDCAHFSLAPAPAERIGLRYDIGPPCDVPAAAGYGMTIRFAHPVDAAAITAIPDWGP